MNTSAVESGETQTQAAQLPQINYNAEWLLREQSERGHITRVLREIQSTFNIDGQCVVELGSGIGTNLTVFGAHNRILGVEGLDDAVSESRRRGIDTVQADLDRPLDLPPGSADWILCLDVLEHLMNPVVCLRSAHAMLRPGGGLVVNVPNHFNWRGRLNVVRGSGIDSQGYFPDSPHWAYPHLRFFTRASIEAMLKTAGFVVEVDYTPRFLAFPKQHVWQSIGLGPMLERLQARRPDLFSNGFYLLCRKS